MGKECNFKLKSEVECQKAANELYAASRIANATYGGIKASKHFFPRGCIFDDRNPFQPYVYWNIKGTNKSQNKKIRTICKNAPYNNLNPDPLSRSSKSYFCIAIYKSSCKRNYSILFDLFLCFIL